MTLPKTDYDLWRGDNSRVHTHTHSRTDTQTDPGNDIIGRPKLASYKLGIWLWRDFSGLIRWKLLFLVTKVTTLSSTGRPIRSMEAQTNGSRVSRNVNILMLNYSHSHIYIYIYIYIYIFDIEQMTNSMVVSRIACYSWKKWKCMMVNIEYMPLIVS